MVGVVLSRKRKGSDNRQLPDDGMVTAEYPEEGKGRGRERVPGRKYLEI